MHLILASASPRRAELLAAAGFVFDVFPVEIDEQVRAGEPPDVYVQRLAREKSARALEALSRSDRLGDDEICVLGADTCVVVDEDVLGKPREDRDAPDGADARAMLRRLSGRRHEVMTGVSLRRGNFELGRVERTAVFLAPLRDEEVDWYVQSGEGRDKAGGYAIQGLASRFIRRIDGSYSNVVGLPIATVHELLRQVIQHKHLT